MEIMTVKDYAKHIQSNVFAVRKLISNGTIPACKIGVGYRIDVKGADNAIAELMRGHAEAVQCRKSPSSNYLARLKALGGCI